MSEKIYDGKGRWRKKTVGFRVSPEEDAQIETAVQISGLSKQDYLIRRVLEREVTVLPNPRVFKALRNNLDSVLNELQRLESVNAENDELLDLIRYITQVLDDLKGECQCR
jgi:uncharacterized protein (DUF1778 family)